MHRIARYRPSPAMIVAIIALVLALGGTSYAAIVLPANSVGTAQLKKSAVTSAKVKNGSLTLADIKASSLSSLARVAMGSSQVSIPAGNITTTVTTATITAPTKGFVLVNGYLDAEYPNARVGMTLWDNKANTSSQWFMSQEFTVNSDMSVSNGWVFPVTAGARTFSMKVNWNSSSVDFIAYGTITAQFIPYGATGSHTVLGIKKSATASPAQH